MQRSLLLFGALLAFAACDREPDLEEDPDFAVPGQTVAQPPAGQPPGAMAMPVTTAPPTYDPPLAVPGQPSPLPLRTPPMPPGVPPGQMPPGQMPPGQVPPGQVPPGQVPPGQVPPGQVPPGQVPAAPLSLTPGFAPPVTMAQGSATGQIPASQLGVDPTCLGNLGSSGAFVSAQPNHVVNLTTDFANLGILVRSDANTALIVRQSNGTFRCNGDMAPDVTNPAIRGAFAPGPHSIWVATIAPGASAPYVIGFTENPAVMPDNLRP